MYGSEQGFLAWMDANGFVLPEVPDRLSSLLSRASGFIDAQFGERFKGVTAAVDQPDQWPRSGVVVNGRVLPDDLVPLAIVQATYRAALAEGQGINLSRTIDPAAPVVKRERVDVIETEYFQPPADAASAAPVVTGLDGLLAPYLRPVGARVIGGFVI